MRILTLRRLIAVVGIATIFCGALYVTSLFRSEPVFRNPENELYTDKYGDLRPTESGPWPRVELETEDIQFGKVLENDEAVQIVRLGNSGDAPLRVRSGDPECDCQLLGLPDTPIAMGESVDLRYVWKPLPGAIGLRQPYPIVTNDPKKRRILLRIVGDAVPLYVATPSGEWRLRTIKEVEATEFVGSICSAAKTDFVVESVDFGGAPIDVALRPIESGPANSLAFGTPGYEIRLKVRPEMPVGPFQYPIKIRTNIPPIRKSEGVSSEQITDVEVKLTGRRNGPFRIVGTGWFEETSVLYFGTFAASTGRTKKYSFLCEHAAPLNLQVLKIEVDADPLIVEFQKDEKFQGTGAKFDLIVSFPPSASASIRKEPNAVRVRIVTDHPTCPDFSFLCDYSAN